MKISAKFIVLTLATFSLAVAGCSKDDGGSPNRRAKRVAPPSLPQDDMGQDQPEEVDDLDSQGQTQNGGQSQRPNSKNKAGSKLNQLNVKNNKGSKSSQNKNEAQNIKSSSNENSTNQYLVITKSQSTTAANEKSNSASKPAQTKSQSASTSIDRSQMPVMTPYEKPKTTLNQKQISTEHASNTPQASNTTNMPVQTQQTNSAPKTTSASKASAAAPTKPTSTGTANNVKVKRTNILRAEVIYADNFASTTSRDGLINIKKLFGEMDMLKAKLAQVKRDESYNVAAITKNDPTPQFSNSAYLAIAKTGACDLNSIGGCVVLERDSDSGKTIDVAYFIGTASEKDDKKVIQVVRLESKTLSKGQIALALNNRADGIYVYSTAKNESESKRLALSLVEAPMNQNAAGIGQYTYATSAEDAAEFDRAFSEAEDEATAGDSKAESRDRKALFNKCAVISSDRIINRQTGKPYGTGLKTVRRLFIHNGLIDVLTFGLSRPDDAEGSLMYPMVKKGKGRLLCYLKDGRRQSVGIEIKDFSNRIGVAFSKSTISFVASGIGWANGAEDILRTVKFPYLIQGDAFLLIGGASYAPFVISGNDKSKILAGTLGFGILRPGLVNANVSLTGFYTITIDPDDT